MVTDGFNVRRVVVGRADDGAPEIRSDGTPPLTIDAPTGFGVSELLSSTGPLTSFEAGGDPPRDAVGAFPANGGVAARLIRFPATNEWVRIAGDAPERPGMHRSETLDLMVVLSGRIVLGVEDREDEVAPGDAVIQRGTLHRWRVAGAEPCTYLSVLLAPVEGATVPSPPLATLHPNPGPRLFVTGTGPQASTVEAAGTKPPDEYGRRQWWDTGGPLRAVHQGGIGGGPGQDYSKAPGAASLTTVDLAAASAPNYSTGQGSIDLVVVLAGTVTTSLAAPGNPSLPGATSGTAELSLSMGDVLITRDVALSLASSSARLAVVSFVPASPEPTLGV
jgi:quercetin dioxygenase-like cupin family protein